MEAHIDNPSNHRFYWEGDLMDDKVVENKIVANIHFGNEDLDKIFSKLIDIKMSIWVEQNQNILGYNNINYTTVNHERGVIVD